MGAYSEYLDRKMSFEELNAERKKQLRRIAELRGRDILVYASAISKPPPIPNSIDYSDIMPFSDQLSNLNGDKVDLILETPGGLAEVVEDIVNLLRKKYEQVGVIIPGVAKSAGTILTMAADEILMSDNSSLGPIDAQILSNGKRFSADAFLEGIKKIRDEAQAKQRLDLAYIPILSSISPGEIQHCENAQTFSKRLVTDWLKQYKFKFWETHSSDGRRVTEEDKAIRAEEIAARLCNHSHWLTHGRSIKIADLQDMRLKIEDYADNPDLNDAITKYYTLLCMALDSNIYKIYETPETQIYRMANNAPQGVPGQNMLNQLATPAPVIIQFECGKCKNVMELQANVGAIFPLKDGAQYFPDNNILKCNKCGTESDIIGLRQEIEAQTGKQVLKGGQ